MSGRALLAALVLVLSGASAARAQQELGDEIRRLLHEGMDLYKRGQFDQAYAKFEEAIQKQPSNDLVYAFIKRVGDDVVAGMMNAPDEKLRNVGYRLFEIAKPGEVVRKGKAEVLRYIEDLQSKDFAVYRNAHFHLKNFGSWALRFLVSVLGNDQQDEFRSRVILLLTEMGSEATLAVVEALDSNNAFLRQNAAIVLGNVKDERAIPALKRVYEDPNEPPEVKKFAHEALQKITRKTSAEWKRATDYYYELADKYYHSHPSVVLAWNRAHLIFRWDAERHVLTEREVPRFAFNEQLAEEALVDCLALDPNYVHPQTKGSAWSLLACVNFAEAIEAEAGIWAAEQAVAAGDPGLLPDHVENLKKLLAGADRHSVLGKLSGKQHLYEALARSLREGNPAVATEILDTLRVMGRPEELPGVGADGRAGEVPGAALIEALTNEDKRVRYAAAEAVARINPLERKLGLELVIPSLVDALGEQGVRVALVIYDVQDEKDRNYVNGLKKLLTSIGVFPVVAASGGEGIIKAKQFPTEDVILIQRKVASQIYFRETEVRKPVVDTVFDTLRDDVRTRGIPRLLICDGATSPTRDIEEEIAAAKQQYDQTAHGYVPSTAAREDFQGLFERLFDSEQAQVDAKRRADEIARRAAETLADVEPTNTLLPYRDAVDALIKTVNPETLRQDFIRIPAARALGRYGDPRAIDVLAKGVDDKAPDEAKVAEQKPFRMAAATSLVRIFRAAQVAPTHEVYELLKKNLLDGDLDIERLCAEALGNAKLSNAQRLDLERHRRVNDRRPSRTADDE